MKAYTRAAGWIALLWAGVAAAQGTVMNGDSSGAARKPGTQGAVGTAGASAVKRAAPAAGASEGASQSRTGKPASEAASPQ
jgi:hypothetical protein